MSRARLQWVGIAVAALGLIAFCMVPPAFIPGISGGDPCARWMNVVEGVYWSAGGTGLLTGIGVGALGTLLQRVR